MPDTILYLSDDPIFYTPSMCFKMLIPMNSILMLNAITILRPSTIMKIVDLFYYC